MNCDEGQFTRPTTLVFHYNVRALDHSLKPVLTSSWAQICVRQVDSDFRFPGLTEIQGHGVLKKIVIFYCATLLMISVSVAGSRPNQVVLGYSAYWFDDQFPPENYNFGTITHLARAFLEEHADGSIGVPEGYFNEKMEDAARRHDVRLLMSIGGEADKADKWLSIAEHPQYRDRFMGQLAQLLSAHHYDGFDIDWEPSALTNQDGAAYTSLLKSLRTRFPKVIITTALPADEYWVSHFSWPDVCNNVDYINVMVYCYSGAWAGNATYASNLYPPGAYAPEPGYSADEGMHNLIDNHHVPPEKLLFGLTFWGLRFNVNHMGDAFPKDTPGYCNDISYAQATALSHTGLYHDLWDKRAAMPYLVRNTGGSVVAYENPASITLKCLDAQKLGCAGVMIWHLGSDVDGLHTPLMDEIARATDAVPEPLPQEMLKNQFADVEEQIKISKIQLAHLLTGHSSPGATQAIAANDTFDISELNWPLLTKRWGIISDLLWQAQSKQKKIH
jgi:chitinase